MRNTVTFLVTLILGLAGGLYLGWVAFPVQYTDTTQASLRQSAKDEVVLMTAALYAAEGDPAAAQARLAPLGGEPGALAAGAAQRFLAANAPAADLARLARLAAAFNALPPELQPYLP